MSNIDDNFLKMYIDEIFQVYDTDRSEFLDPDQLTVFFNELYGALHEPRRFTDSEIMQILNANDLNNDGKI